MAAEKSLPELGTETACDLGAAVAGDPSTYPDVPGQGHKATRTVGVTAPIAPVRGFSAVVRGSSRMLTDA